MGFENCKVGFEKKMNWEMGLVTPFRTFFLLIHSDSEPII